MLILPILTTAESPGIFLYVPSAVTVVGLTLGGLAVSFGKQQLWGAFRLALSGGPDPSGRSTTILTTGRACAISAGVVGLLIQIIALLANLSHPSELGLGLALPLTPCCTA